MDISLTVDQLMKSTGLDRVSCYGLLHFLEAVGIATRTAAPRLPKQRGRSQAVYTLPDTFALKLHQLLSKQDLVDLFAGSSDTMVEQLIGSFQNELDNVAAAG